MSDLRLDAVRHRYAGAGADALREVSVSVAAGRMVSVVGPSGSGKTTLLRVAAGLETPTAGQVLIDGRDVTGLPTERRDVTVMFQQPNLFEHLDTAGNVGFPARVAGLSRKQARERARRYLDLVHLGDLADRPVSDLSGGQQQRVALARALAAERSVLLLDEPFSSLDRELRERMHDLLAEVREALDPTVLFVTHDLDEAALADSTVVLIDGVVHQQAPVATLHREPATLSVARLVGGFTEVPGSVLDGTHTSAWGTTRIAPNSAAASGDAVLLIPREHLSLTSQPDDVPVGVDLQISGRVTRRRRRGAREIALVEPAPGQTVEVTLGSDQACEVGTVATVSARLSRPARAVPAATP